MASNSLQKKEYPFPVPKHLFRIKGFHGSNQRVFIAYAFHRSSCNPSWRFNPVEVSKVLGIHRSNSWRLLQSFVAKGLLNDVGNKRIDIPENLQAYGMTHFLVHEYTANLNEISAIMFPETVARAKKSEKRFDNFVQRSAAIVRPYESELEAYEKRLKAECVKRNLSLGSDNFQQVLEELTPVIGKLPEFEKYRNGITVLKERFYPRK